MQPTVHAVKTLKPNRRNIRFLENFLKHSFWKVEQKDLISSSSAPFLIRRPQFFQQSLKILMSKYARKVKNYSFYFPNDHNLHTIIIKSEMTERLSSSGFWGFLKIIEILVFIYEWNKSNCLCANIRHVDASNSTARDRTTGGESSAFRFTWDSHTGKMNGSWKKRWSWKSDRKLKKK